MQDILLDRRSIRRYRPDPVDEKTLREIVEAGMFAPSANNRRPWHFIVVNDRARLDEIIGLHPYVNMLREAPAAVIVCGDRKRSPEFWMIDCAAATENLLLAAFERGLGSCWCGIAPHEDRMGAFAKAFALPEEISAFAVVVLGKADEQKPRPDRFMPERLHFNNW